MIPHFMRATRPLDFISKLAALIPAPRVNLTRFHGIFAPNSKYRADIINQPSDNKPADKSVQTEGESGQTYGGMSVA